MDKGLIVYYITGITFVVIVSLVMYYVSVRFRLRLPSWFMSLCALFSCYMIFTQYSKYFSLHFYEDFAHWAQIFHNIATTGKPLCLSLEFYFPGAMNYFSVHFAPLIYILALPFKILPYNETIIGLNLLLMMSSVIPLYKISLDSYQDKRFALFMVLLLLWYPTFQYTVMYEFEMLRFSIPIILWMLYFWQKGKVGPYFIFVLLAVLVREEVGLTIMMFGLYLILFKKQWRTGFTTAVVGLGAFIIITQAIMPSLSGASLNDGHLAIKKLYGVFGETVGEAVVTILTNPLLTIKTIFQPIKIANIFMYFLPLLFIPFLRPAVLMAVFANLGIVLLSSNNKHSSYMLYYLSPSIPFIFYAFIKGWPRFLSMLDRYAVKIRGDYDLKSAAMIFVLSGLMITNVFFGPSPISLQFWFRNLRPAPFRTQNFHYSVYKISDHHRKANAFFNLMPDTAIVAAQRFLHPRMFKKKGITLIGKREGLDGRYKADYVLFDKTNNNLKKESPDYIAQSRFDLIENDKATWELVKSKDGYYLYRRIGGY